MIQVTMRRAGGKCSIAATGHAGHGPPGADIVCAGVSSLVQALHGYLKNNQGVQVDEAERTAGFASYRFEDNGQSGPAYDLVRIGLLQIQKSYPDCLKVVWEQEEQAPLSQLR